MSIRWVSSDAKNSLNYLRAKYYWGVSSTELIRQKDLDPIFVLTLVVKTRYVLGVSYAVHVNALSM